MELRDYIEAGVKISGSVQGLAHALGMEPNSITNAKAHRRGLPNYACFRLAQLLQVDKGDVVAASELVTEKDPEKRAVFIPFVRGVAMTVAWIVAVTVTLFVTNPTEAEANQTVMKESFTAIYIMRSTEDV